MKNLTLTYITISLLFLYITFAQKVLASPATPEPNILQFPSLLITEVDFKNNEHDKIVLTVLDDMNDDKGSTLKGLALKDDSKFFELEDDIYIRSNEIITISFKNETQKINTTEKGITINLTKSGLTGTTEQVILLYNSNQVLDAVCWTNSNPTQSEIEELEELFNQNEWNSKSPDSCIDSDSITKNQPIQRKSLIDTNSKNDWELFIEEEIVEEVDVPVIKEIEETDENDDSCKTDIYISEFLPNPSGKDSDNEWIEIMNSSESTCSLYGWKIDDQEGGSKAFLINSNELVPPAGYVLLPSWKTKINLNNSEDSVRLFNPKDELVDEIEYEKSPEQNSYAYDFENEIFKWTTSPTPLTENIFSKEILEKETAEEEESKPTIQNGTLSDELKITEIFPNPAGQDKGLEWIEIFNNSQETVNLGNWTIESDSKKYTFQNISIESKTYITVSDSDLGFSLKNSDANYQLKDFNKNIISDIQYEKTIEGQSFMEIKTIQNDNSNNSWIWAENPTPGEENYTYYSFSGIVNNFDEINGNLQITINKDRPDEEILDISVLLTGDQIINSVFQIGSTLQVTVQNKNNKWILLDYSILSEPNSEKPETDSNSLIYIVLSSIPPLGFLGYSAARKFGFIKIV